MAVFPRRAFWLAAIFTPLVFVAGGAIAWTVDSAAHDGRVMRNVELDGRPIGGVSKELLTAVVDELGSEYAQRPLAIVAPDRTLEGTAGQFGLVLDSEATITAALGAGRSEGTFSDWASWANGFFEDHKVEPIFRVDRVTTIGAVSAFPEAVHRKPIEPSFAAVEGRLDVKSGVNGLAVGGDSVADALEELIEGPFPDRVEVEWTTVPPTFDDADLDAAVEQADLLTARRVPVMVGGRGGVIAPETLRRWVRSSVVDGQLVPIFDEATAHRSLEAHLTHLATVEVLPTFSIVDGEVVIELGPPVLQCCQAGVADEMLAAVAAGRPAQLQPRLRDDDGGAAAAEALGVRQLIAEFTTQHRCCQARVGNIHRIADLLRGQLILPGAIFSINDTIGERTVEKGFVEAGVIEAGRFEKDVGGGISQFATTMFNAAFFAGLDFVDYQSHSIYISRYPYGREATLGFPAPDLVLANNTPWAMLVWTSYTDASITVQLWSTPYFEVEQTSQARYRVFRCRRADTHRSRTTPGGQVIEDFVFAQYRPGEGLDCFGNPIPRRRS